jgi:trans-2,3-dihydro-3-hydroxyanthranilate isomerase
VARAIRLDLNRADEYLARVHSSHFYFVTRETVDPGSRLHARMIFYGGEDPATGSAAGCAAAWMVAHGVARSEERVLIEQGIEVGRPSQIHVRAEREQGNVRNVRVGGQAIQVMSGEVVL